MSERVQKALRHMVDKRQVVVLIPGAVHAVNGVKSCDVLPSDGGAELFDVRLKAVLGDGEAGAYIVPKKDSPCVVGLINGDPNQAMLMAADDIERLVMRLDGKASLELGPNGSLKINGDDYGGVIKWDDLKSDLDKLKTFMQTLLQAIQSATVTPNDGGASFKASLIAATATLQVPQFLNITSDKTKHGSAT